MAEITAVTQHSSITGENVHVPYAGQFANETARLSAQLDSSSEGKIYRQLDTNKLWMLVSASGPVWEIVGSDDFVSKSKGGSFDAPISVPSPLTVQAQDDNEEGGEIILKGAGTNPDIFIDGHGKLLRIMSSAGERYINLATGETNFITGGIELLTSSGTYIVKKTGPHFVLIVGGGSSGYGAFDTSGGGGGGGARFYCANLTKGQQIAYTVGGGGPQGLNSRKGQAGGASVFNGVSAPGGGQYGTPGNWLATTGSENDKFSKNTGGLSIISGYGGGGGTTWDRDLGLIGYAGQSGVIIVIS